MMHGAIQSVLNTDFYRVDVRRLSQSQIALAIVQSLVVLVQIKPNVKQDNWSVKVAPLKA